MRVVAGEFGGRRLVAPEGTSTRPTTDRVREAVFNSLQSMGVLDGAIVVDLFAGSGALGIEALSRGAAQCTFVERERSALAALRANIASLGIAERCTVREADAMSWLASIGSVDIVFADPPYAFNEWPALLERIADCGLLVAEADVQVDPVDGWQLVRSRRYGRTWVTVLER